MISADTDSYVRVKIWCGRICASAWSELLQNVCSAPHAAEPPHSAAGVRFLITWREWERRFQCELFGSRAWFIFAASARAAKITWILRKRWRTGRRTFWCSLCHASSYSFMLITLYKLVCSQWRCKSAPGPYAKKLYGPPNEMGSNSVTLLIFLM